MYCKMISIFTMLLFLIAEWRSRAIYNFIIVFVTIAYVHNSLSRLLIFMVLLLLLLLHVIVHLNLLIVHLSCIQICGRGR